MEDEGQEGEADLFILGVQTMATR